MRSCALILAAFLIFTSSINAQANVGTISGTVVFVSDTGKFVAVAPSTTIHVRIEELNGEFTADDIGDFMKQIPAGKYLVTGVIGCGGQEFILYEKQQRDFLVSPGAFQRFDVMVKAPEQKYACPQK